MVKSGQVGIWKGKLRKNLRKGLKPKKKEMLVRRGVRSEGTNLRFPTAHSQQAICMEHLLSHPVRLCWLCELRIRYLAGWKTECNACGRGGKHFRK